MRLTDHVTLNSDNNMSTAAVFWNIEKASREKAGSNTSTLALRVVGGDENGSLESETVKDCAGKDQQQL
jgi:hypothetical protein